MKIKTITRRIAIFVVAASIVVTTLVSFGYAKASSPFTTEWSEKITPENAWRSYPRPQLVREGQKVLKFNTEKLKSVHKRLCDIVNRQ